jgi:tetratricopeptide (TPR) repeat protein
MLFVTIILLVISVIVPAVNPHLRTLIEITRGNVQGNADDYWDLYTESIIDEKLFSENTQQLGGLHNIKKHETSFADKLITEAEFCQQIGLDFANNVMPMESKWFLNKAEKLGLVTIETYYARAKNYAREWNNILHYNADLSDSALEACETKWRENLLLVIENSQDSMDIERTRFELITIYNPSRTPIFTDDFAPEVVNNLEEFIDNYPKSPVIHQAYERLVWWLYTTEDYAKLGKVCKNFINNYLDSPIIEYVKFQLANAYYFIDNFAEATEIYNSIQKELLPNSVYPGWQRWYIIEKIDARLDSIKLNLD